MGYALHKTPFFSKRLYIMDSYHISIMAKKQGVSLPSGQGGIIGGVESAYHTKVEFSPKFVIFFAILVVIVVFLLFRTY